MTGITYRPYTRERDEKAVIRIWQECGWLDMKKNRKARDAFRLWVECGTADVAEFRGNAECLVTTHRGSICMMDEDLPFRGVTSVTAGRVMRRMGGAGELTALALARAAREGDAVAGLGIFDQGFYDKLGFGNFPYVRHISINPLSLKVPPLERAPIRLKRKDLPRIHSNIRRRMRHHGLVRFSHQDVAGLIMTEEDIFGLGFEDEEGQLTHHFLAAEKGESGPYRMLWMVYRTYDELIELLSLVRNLGDQVYTFNIREPWGIQIQDLISRPLRSREASEGSKFENRMEAISYKQARILDLERPLAALRIPGESLRFNLRLSDPIERFLPEDHFWKGLGGDWTVETGEAGSSAVRGHAADLPMMEASVNAFTRLLFGVSTPSGLSVTDNLRAPEKLLADLDSRLRLPEPDMVQIF